MALYILAFGETQHLSRVADPDGTGVGNAVNGKHRSLECQGASLAVNGEQLDQRSFVRNGERHNCIVSVVAHMQPDRVLHRRRRGGLRRFVSGGAGRLGRGVGGVVVSVAACLPVVATGVAIVGAVGAARRL